jgi:hypothetical protein
MYNQALTSTFDWIVRVGDDRTVAATVWDVQTSLLAAAFCFVKIRGLPSGGT